MRLDGHVLEQFRLLVIVGVDLRELRLMLAKELLARLLGGNQFFLLLVDAPAEFGVLLAEGLHLFAQRLVFIRAAFERITAGHGLVDRLAQLRVRDLVGEDRITELLVLRCALVKELPTLTPCALLLVAKLLHTSPLPVHRLVQALVEIGRVHVHVNVSSRSQFGELPVHLVERARVDARIEINRATSTLQPFDLLARAHRVQIRIQMDRLVIQTFQHGLHLTVEATRLRFNSYIDGTRLEPISHTRPHHQNKSKECLWPDLNRRHPIFRSELYPAELHRQDPTTGAETNDNHPMPNNWAVIMKSSKPTSPEGNSSGSTYEGECTGDGFASAPHWARLHASTMLRISVNSIVSESHPSHGNTTGPSWSPPQSLFSDSKRARYKLSGIMHKPSIRRTIRNADNPSGQVTSNP